MLDADGDIRDATQPWAYAEPSHRTGNLRADWHRPTQIVEVAPAHEASTGEAPGAENDPPQESSLGKSQPKSYKIPGIDVEPHHNYETLNLTVFIYSKRKGAIHDSSPN